ncbi:MAG: T9SS type A sorting domain-containing protein [Bacteroidota bacterium]
MKKVLTLWVLFFTCTCLFSQNDRRIARTKTPLSEIEKITMPPQDNAALLEAEMKRRGPGIAPRFAVNFETNISPETHGKWERLLNGNALWRLRIFSKGAKSLNLGFTKYNMPRGGSLMLYSPDGQIVRGPFTPADNEAHEQLWTPILDGEEMVIEVQVPEAYKDQLGLELKYVNHDFVGLGQLVSGSCNLDVACGEADGWGIVDKYRDIIQSVGVYTGNGQWLCTGFLVNNARQDCTPYFMTADHCGIGSGNAASVVAYWNFENSTCRQPNSPASGGNGNGSLSDFNTGTIFRAGSGQSDFTLLELDDPVSETADAFFAGWSAESFAPQDTVITIHHPNTDEKRISFEFDPTFRSNYLGENPIPNGDHITVEDWDIGTTETGSSGAPIFNKQKRVVGQLHGGFAACGNDELDSYGFFHTSWEGGGTPNTRLKDWLDPDNTGIIVLDGRAAAQCNFFVAATPTIVELCSPEEAQYTITVSESFTSDVDLSVVGLSPGLTASFSDNPVVPGGSAILTIGGTGMVSGGGYTFNVVGTDGTESNFSNLILDITSAAPAVPVLSTPADGATNISLMPTFSWGSLPDVTYEIQVATDVDFTNIIIDETNFSNTDLEMMAQLDEVQKYYWRVKASNICGGSDWSDVFAFTTASVECVPFVSTDVPVQIPSSGAPVVTSTIEVTTSGIIDDINVNNIVINHSWVSDLRLELTSPQGKTIELMNNVFGGSCGEDNLAIAFDDQSASPYSDLDDMCNNTSPALSGLFQPSEVLREFSGDDAMGTWTLTVFDDVDQDGGNIESWELEICTIVVNDFSVNPSLETVTNCTGDEISFNIILGTGFDSANGVSLSANGLPAGASATFDPNPAQPGQQVTVTLNGAMDAGTYDLDIIADDGNVTSSAQVEWQVIGEPSATSLISPAQNATGVGLSSNFTWVDSGSAGYEVNFATDPAFDDIIFNSTVMGANQITVPTLNFCTTYYWQVIVFNDCGESDATETFSFTTEDDLSFTAAPVNAVFCTGSTATVPVVVGDCFESVGLTLSTNSLPSGIEVDFPVNPVFSNSTIDVEVTISNVATGTYTITINGNDGVNSVSTSFEIEVIGPAALANLLLPANNAVDVEVEPTLTWDPVPGATNYIIELATDADFMDIVFETNQTSTTLTLPVMLENLTIYHWRVTAFNDCGGSTSLAYSFTTEEFNAVVEMDGVQLEIMPNPTSGLVWMISTTPLQEKMSVQVFSINGIQLIDQVIGQGGSQFSIDLTGYPAGIYLLRLSTEHATSTERIILK